VLIDAIELNAQMPNKTELVKISDMTERFVVLSFGVMYAGLCPLTGLIVFVYFLMDSIAMRKTDMYCMRRPFA
jgi:hypothetical protein